MENLVNYLRHYASTIKHKFWVAYYMARLYPAIRNHVALHSWVWRAIKHDWSKFTPTQARDFAAVIEQLSKSEYGSKEYKANTRRPGIKLHVCTEDHHPQYWRSGSAALDAHQANVEAFELMSKIAQREMICDWAAAVRRNPNGSLIDSILGNAERFGYDEVAAHILLGYAIAMGAVEQEKAREHLRRA